MLFRSVIKKTDQVPKPTDQTGETNSSSLNKGGLPCRCSQTLKQTRPVSARRLVTAGIIDSVRMSVEERGAGKLVCRALSLDGLRTRGPHHGFLRDTALLSPPTHTHIQEHTQIHTHIQYIHKWPHTHTCADTHTSQR